jgi:diguanylate cyclase (GGDEF)-like protein
MFAKELSHSRRTENRLIFAMLDVDNFKKYNDTYGHQMGDTVLIELSKALQSSFQRSHDLVFRLGGEEFGILFSLKSNDDIFRLVDRARQNIQNLEIAHEKNEAGVVTASFGVIEIQSDYTRLVKEEMDFAYKEADKALYKAKESGRNRVCII